MGTPLAEVGSPALEAYQRRRKILLGCGIALAGTLVLGVCGFVGFGILAVSLGTPKDGPGCVQPATLADGGVVWTNHCVDGVRVSPAPSGS